MKLLKLRSPVLSNLFLIAFSIHPQAVSKTLREDEQLHARIQFAHCDADGDGAVTLADLKSVSMFTEVFVFPCFCFFRNFR
jgi:hypothetical protein